MSVGGLEAASSALKRGAFKECANISTRGIRDAEVEGNATEVWWFRCLLSQCLGTQGRFREALSLVETEESSGQLDLLGLDVRVQLITQRAFYLSRIGNYLLAKNVLDQAADLVRAAANEVLFCEVQLNRMTLFFYLADYASMEECARSSLAVAQEHGLPIVEAGASSGMGKSFMVRRQFVEAIPWFERAHAIFLQEGLPFHAVGILSELGCCHYGLHEDEKALRFFSEALQASLGAGAMPSYQIDLANIGNIYLRRGEYAAAISNYQKALDIARELGDSISVAKWLGNLALTYARMGNPALAKAYELEAEKVKQKVDEARAAAS